MVKILTTTLEKKLNQYPMSIKAKRKITYYHVSLKGPGDSQDVMREVLDRIIDNNNTKSNSRRKRTKSGLYMYMQDCNPYGNVYYYCRLLQISDSFPEVIDKIEARTEEIDAEYDDNKGIKEETHFVVKFIPGKDTVLFAVESNQKGPKKGEITRYLDQILVNLGYENLWLFEPVFALNLETFMDRIDGVSQVNLMFHHDQIEGFKRYDASLGEMIDAAQRYGESEYVSLKFYIDFKTKQEERHSSTGLKQKLAQLLGIIRNRPEVKQHMHRFDVRAQDSQNNGRLQLFDLLESKMASEIIAERKRKTSQYFDSTYLYEAIRTQIEEDFGV